MITCTNKDECSWVWVNKIPDLYVPGVEEPDACEYAKDYSYIDIYIYVCKNCGETKVEVT